MSLTILLLVFSLVSTSQNQEQVRDRDRIVGKWKVTEVKSDSKTDGLAAGMILEFKDDVVHFIRDKAIASKFQYRLNERSSPKEIDFVLEKPAQTHLCIYELGPVDISSGRLLKRRKRALVFAVFATV